jgi:hypothetical protein
MLQSQTSRSSSRNSSRTKKATQTTTFETEGVGACSARRQLATWLAQPDRPLCRVSRRRQVCKQLPQTSEGSHPEDPAPIRNWLSGAKEPSHLTRTTDEKSRASKDRQRPTVCDLRRLDLPKTPRRWLSRFSCVKNGLCSLDSRHTQVSNSLETSKPLYDTLWRLEWSKAVSRAVASRSGAGRRYARLSTKRCGNRFLSKQAYFCILIR